MISQVPKQIVDDLKLRLSIDAFRFSSVGGGCINHGGKLSTADSNYFLKWNDASRFPGMFEAEAKGLALLASTKTIDTPEVVFSGVAEPFQYLVLGFIEQRSRKQNFWQTFGTQLAKLHQQTSAHFGLDHHNYIGSLHQYNHQHKRWSDFFVQERLSKQIELASAALGVSGVKKFEKLYDKIPSLLPDERPALLHGDLWSGNLINSSSGNPCLIDPAVYFGHREADLAMTQLFGGFEPVFFRSYDNEFPLTPGYEERFDIYNLYPLLVHVNLFGGGYAAQVVSILNRFV